MAGVFREIWTGEMIKAFRTPPEAAGWYDRIRSYDQYVDNDVIHFTELGGDPDVLVNNTTYPLNIQELEDADKPVSLDRFDTTATPVTDDELHAVSYDRMSSVLERHREALREKVMQKAIHAIGPDTDSGYAPVLRTTGEIDGWRKKFTVADLLELKRRFDAMGIPTRDRILVLCSDHVNDLLETEQRFKEHYNINQTDGRIARLYGFDIYEYNGTPWYDASTGGKLGWGKTPGSGDTRASVAFYAGRMMKANGSVQFYHSEAKSDPLYHRNLVNFTKWGICLPLSRKNCTAAIVSGKEPFEVSPKELEFAAAGETKKVTVKNNTGEIKINGAPEWTEVSVKNGTITVKAQKNESAAREGTVFCSFSRSTFTIKVKQAGNQ